MSFESFLGMYEARHFEARFSATKWDHIDPITTDCHFQELAYNCLLRLEEETLWFNWFVERYGMTKSMEAFRASGNLVFSLSIDASARVADYVPYIIGKQPWPGKVYNSSHHRDSVSKFLGFYTPAIARNVTRLFLGDFTRFGYPIWDGELATFRFV